MSNSLTQIIQKAVHDRTLASLHIDLQRAFYRENTPVAPAFDACAGLDRTLDPLARQGTLQKIWVVANGANKKPTKVRDLEISESSRQFIIVSPHPDDTAITKGQRSVTANPFFMPHLISQNRRVIIGNGVFGSLCAGESFALTMRASQFMKHELDFIIATDGVDGIQKDIKGYRDNIIAKARVSKKTAARLHVATNDEIEAALLAA